MALLPASDSEKSNSTPIKGQLIFFVVIFIGLFAWTMYNRSQAIEKQELLATQQAVVAAAADTMPKISAQAAAPVQALPQAPKKETILTFGDKQGSLWHFNTETLGLVRAELNLFPLESAFPDSPTTLFSSIAALTPSFYGCQNDRNECTAVDSTTLQVKSYYSCAAGTFTMTTIGHFGTPDTYAAAFDFTFENTSPNAFQIPVLSLCTGALPSQQNLSGETSYSEYFTINAYNGKDQTELTFNEDPEDFPSELTQGPYPYASVQNKYIFIALSADKQNPFAAVFPRRTLAGSKELLDKTELYAWVQLPGALLNSGAKSTAKVTLYAGPKNFENMQKVNPELCDAVNISYFSWFEPLSRFFLNALVWINQFCGNFGISIIVLTLIVRLLLWPLQHKGSKSMRKMQQIQPRMKELQAKYKDNQQLLSQKMMELYKEEGVNPVSGCLPMLIQLPIFIALYGSLNGVEMRGESFLWIADLSKPDNVGTLFGIAIHPLIIAETIIMIIQQKFSPSSATMQGSQRYMMMLMPAIILFMFYNLPAGLTLYMTVSMIPQIAQDMYIRYTTKTETSKKTS